MIAHQLNHSLARSLTRSLERRGKRGDRGLARPRRQGEERREKRGERRAKREERGRAREERREKTEERPKEAARGPQMRPPEVPTEGGTAISLRQWTPGVVSSLTPRQSVEWMCEVRTHSLGPSLNRSLEKRGMRGDRGLARPRRQGEARREERE